MQWIANVKTKEALALAKNDFVKAQKYKLSLSRIEESVAKIIDQKIEFVLEDDPLNVIIKVNEQELEFDLLPDGLKSIISWISDLLMRMDRIKWKDEIDPLDRNFILFLDEIDVHLHPAWQRKILPIVQDLFKNAQIFITTHSPFVVGSVDGAWIHKLNKNKPIEPVLSEDSKSYTLILNEIFGIDKYFGVEIEKKLEDFRALRNKIMSSNEINEVDLSDLKSLIHDFKAEKSMELDAILGREINQLKRVLNLDNLEYA